MIGGGPPQKVMKIGESDDDRDLPPLRSASPNSSSSEESGSRTSSPLVLTNGGIDNMFVHDVGGSSPSFANQDKDDGNMSCGI